MDGMPATLRDVEIEDAKASLARLLEERAVLVAHMRTVSNDQRELLLKADPNFVADNWCAYKIWGSIDEGDALWQTHVEIQRHLRAIENIDVAIQRAVNFLEDLDETQRQVNVQIITPHSSFITNRFVITPPVL